MPLSAIDWRIQLPDGGALRFSPFGGSARLEEGWYSPEFGRRMRNKVLAIEISGSLPMECGYVLERMTKDHA